VAAAKKKKAKKGGSAWSWRLAGLVLCAFFALGLMTGMSRSGRTLALRFESLLDQLPGRHSALLSSLDNLRAARRMPSAIQSAPRPAGAIALVERADGFYALDPSGALQGPVSPSSQGDLPILSGAGVENAAPAQLLDQAAVLVRAEAELSAIVSEMRVGADGLAALFIDHPAIELTLDLDRTSDELPRAARVMRLWRGHQDLIAALDLTVPGEAVVRVRPSAATPATSTRTSRRRALAASSRHSLEVTARR
jgi:hypothetical protein